MTEAGWDQPGPSRPGNYAEQAATYDRTRGASPTIVRRLLAQLGPADGRSLLDIAGGTGNYAEALSQEGFRPVVFDASFEMIARSVGKIGPGHQVVGDAAALPFEDGSFDCATCVVAIHLFADRGGAFREACRVLQDGPLVVVAYTRENLEALFVHEYFGGRWPEGGGFSAADVRGELGGAGFRRVEVGTFVYDDAVAGSLVAMHTDARLLADPERLRNTSFWHRLPEDIRTRGVERLAADLKSGVLASRVRDSLQRAAEVGHGTVFACWT